MNFPFPRLAAFVSFGFAAPLLATSALADVPAVGTAPQAVEAAAETIPAEAPAAAEVTNETAPQTAEARAPAPDAPAAQEPEEEEELICRSIRLDMSSRRKTRVCRTEEGWRQLNQRR